MKLPKVLLLSTLLGTSLALASCAKAQTNVALHQKITTSKPSNYALTKNKNAAQLVDGKYAGAEYDSTHKTSSLWVQDGSITWSERRDAIVFTIDLGKVMPISGISYSTAAGAASVQFPSFAGIAVSDDGKTWHYQGNLIDLARRNGTPDLNAYTKYRFATRDLQTKGRYVALSVMQFPYTVVDEIEVYSGDSTWLSKPAGGEQITSPAAMEDFATGAIAASFVKRRVAADINGIIDLLDKSSLSAAQKSTFKAQLDKAAKANEQLALPDGNIKTILPITETHQKVMATYGEILAAEGIEPLTVWKQHRYAWLPLLAKPRTKERPGVDISMLGNQFRSDSFLITNASGSPKTVRIELQNAPTKAKTGWLQIDRAVWMDTYQGIPVVDALIPIVGNQVTIPAGFTQKIWLTVDSSKVPAGDYKSTFVVNEEKIPFHLTVADIKMQRPRLSLTMWDYTDPNSMKGAASRGITPQNYDAALKMMQSHYVDSPWATRGILPIPGADDFDTQNNLTTKPSFAAFDKWVAQWPHARQYFVFISAKKATTVGGAKRGTPQFKARLGNWAKVLSAHMEKLGKNPNQLALLIHDEPGLRGAWEDEVIADWAEAINAAAPELTLISDPVWKHPEKESHQAAQTQMDILMPNTQHYESYPDVSKQYFDAQHANGTSLWLYACIGPVRLFAPQNYYRSQAWRVFSMDGDGMGYWAFGDVGGAPTTWHDYQISRSFSPAFIDKDTVYNSIHWDAVREGVEDFEELSMLRDAIKSSKNQPLKTQAQAVLDEAVKNVTMLDTRGRWYKGNAPEKIDACLHNVREMLIKLQ